MRRSGRLVVMSCVVVGVLSLVAISPALGQTCMAGDPVFLQGSAVDMQALAEARIKQSSVSTPPNQPPATEAITSLPAGQLLGLFESYAKACQTLKMQCPAEERLAATEAIVAFQEVSGDKEALRGAYVEYVKSLVSVKGIDETRKAVEAKTSTLVATGKIDQALEVYYALTEVGGATERAYTLP